MTKSALEASRLIDRWENGLSISDHDAISVARALLRLSSDRNDMVERCAEIADKYRAWALAGEADYEVIEMAERIASRIRSLLSKPQEGGER